MGASVLCCNTEKADFSNQSAFKEPIKINKLSGSTEESIDLDGSETVCSLSKPSDDNSMEMSFDNDMFDCSQDSDEDIIPEVFTVKKRITIAGNITDENEKAKLVENLRKQVLKQIKKEYSRRTSTAFTIDYQISFVFTN